MAEMDRHTRHSAMLSTVLDYLLMISLMETAVLRLTILTFLCTECNTLIDWGNV